MMHASSVLEMKSSCKVFLRCFIVIALAKFSSEVVVDTEEGWIDGSIMLNRWGEVFFAFRQIPYAEPPVGTLRFKAPRPKRPWNNILDCTHFGPMCMQDDFWERSIPISEDCLHLNVFTNNLKIDEKYTELRPVIVFLHGGGFEGGSAMNYGPEYLMESE